MYVCMYENEPARFNLVPRSQGKYTGNEVVHDYEP